MLVATLGYRGAFATAKSGCWWTLRTKNVANTHALHVIGGGDEQHRSFVLWEAANHMSRHWRLWETEKSQVWMVQ